MAEEYTGVPPIVEPKVAQYSVSYGNALSAQRNAGRVVEAKRAPQKLPSTLKAESAKQEAKKAAQKPKFVPTRGTAVVKSVPSGDSIVVVGAVDASGFAPEKTITLGGISAPRIGRGKQGKDEPFAFASREFLRKLLLGKSVSFEITYRHEKSGREYGQVTFEGENISHLLLKKGWATALVGNAKKDGTLHPEKQELADLQKIAEEAELGIHNKKVKAKDQVREITWSPSSNTVKNKAAKGNLPAIVDYVRDGSTIRVEVIGQQLKHSMVTVYLSGIQAPRTAPPKSDIKDDPFAQEARNFVDTRLGQRDVELKVDFIDKQGNIFGTLVHPKGNIAHLLVRNGLAKYVPWTSGFIGEAEAADLENMERAAQHQRVGIWSTYVAEEKKAPTSALPGVNSSEFSGKVTQIVSGDTVVIEDANGESKRFYLASVSAPRLGNVRKGVADEDFAAEAKEFLRKKLIGKKVKVRVEYERSAPAKAGDQSARAFVTIVAGKSNVSELLIAEGLAKALPHRVEDPRSLHYDALLNAEDAAKAAKKNLHSGKKPTKKPLDDLTDRPRSKKTADKEKAAEVASKAKGYLANLQRDRNLVGSVEHCFSGNRFKINIPKHGCIASVVLAGIRCPTTGGGNRKAEPFGDEALSFVKQLILQHDVKIEVETLDRGDNFIGSVFVNGGKSNLSVLLLERGFASIYGPSADRSKYKDQLYATEESAKAAKVGVWENWVPPPPEEAKPETKEEDGERELSDNERLLNIAITEVTDSCNFYANVVGDKGIEFVEEGMKAFVEEVKKEIAPADFNVEKGVIAAGLFEDGEWYRVKIESRTPEGNARVSFIDFGNVSFFFFLFLPLPLNTFRSLYFQFCGRAVGLMTAVAIGATASI